MSRPKVEEYLAKGYRSIGHDELIEYLAKEEEGEITYVAAHDGEIISSVQTISVGTVILLHDFVQEIMGEDNMED